MNLNDFIVNVFCETDDFMENFCKSTTLRKRGPAPKLADSEVLTMEIVGEILGLNTDKQIFRFFKRFYSHYFPGLNNRVTFVRQAANLWLIKQRLFEQISRRFRDAVNIVDSYPMPVCKFVRARFCRLFKGIAAYGKELGRQTFYGFRLHVKINSLGMVQAFSLAGANVHDIRMLPDLIKLDQGMLLADRGYLSKPLTDEFFEHGLELSVPTKYSEPTTLSNRELGKRKHIRRLVETVGSQLAQRFEIKKVWARDIWHLTNRICRKILAHTFCVLFCLRDGLSPLSFDKLITI
jgi:hypothetical protein